MLSDRQNAANRSNAAKSTGPRSEAGRGVSRHNVLRHGLAVTIGDDPAFQKDIEKLARVLSVSSGNQDNVELAREAAEAQFELLRIRKVRALLFQTLYFANDNGSAQLAELNQAVAKLERYERRAFSRRKRAFLSLSTSG